MRYVTTERAAKPFSRYSQAVAVEPGERLVFVSGQVGVSASGELAATSQGQHEAVWSNILAILESEGLGAQDLVEVTGYITDPAELPHYRAARDKALNGAAPASTLLVIQALADPRWKVEVSVVAAAKA